MQSFTVREVDRKLMYVYVCSEEQLLTMRDPSSNIRTITTRIHNLRTTAEKVPFHISAHLVNRESLDIDL